MAVKAEFEAEGTRPTEFLWLLTLARSANLKVALKIGGCEAVSDLFASQLYCADHVIAPMVETPYALQKFIEAKDRTHGTNEACTQFFFNLETQTGLANLEEMLPVAKNGVNGGYGIDGIVFGRVDFTLSNGWTREDVNSPEVTQSVLKVARACREANLQLVVGGSVSKAAIAPLRQIHEVRLDRFETRKVVFDGGAIKHDWIEDGIANAVAFELAWLELKQAYYEQISKEDEQRISMMRARLATDPQTRPRAVRLAKG